MEDSKLGMLIGLLGDRFKQDDFLTAHQMLNALEKDCLEQGRAEGRREGLDMNRTHLLHLEAGLEHIIADDDCEQCKANVSQAQFLCDYIRKLLETPR